MEHSRLTRDIDDCVQLPECDQSWDIALVEHARAVGSSENNYVGICIRGRTWRVSNVLRTCDAVSHET